MSVIDARVSASVRQAPARSDAMNRRRRDAARDLESVLTRSIDGEVRFDGGSRALYAMISRSTATCRSAS